MTLWQLFLTKEQRRKTVKSEQNLGGAPFVSLVFWAPILFSIYMKEPFTKSCSTLVSLHQRWLNVFWNPFTGPKTTHMTFFLVLDKKCFGLTQTNAIHPSFHHSLLCSQSGERWIRVLESIAAVATDLQGHAERQQTLQLQTWQALSGNWTSTSLPCCPAQCSNSDPSPTSFILFLVG